MGRAVGGEVPPGTTIYVRPKRGGLILLQTAARPRPETLRLGFHYDTPTSGPLPAALVHRVLTFTTWQQWCQVVRLPGPRARRAPTRCQAAEVPARPARRHPSDRALLSHPPAVQVAPVARGWDGVARAETLWSRFLTVRGAGGLFRRRALFLRAQLARVVEGSYQRDVRRRPPAAGHGAWSVGRGPSVTQG